MDEILYAGDQLYNYVQSKSAICTENLGPCHLPSYISLHDNHFHWMLRKTYSGNIDEAFVEEGPFLTLETALIRSLSVHPRALFTCKGYCIALFQQGDNFFVFDSHARDANGISDCYGKSVLLNKTSIPELSSHLRLLFCMENSDSPNQNNQFDLHALTVNEVSNATIKRYRKKGTCICQLTTCPPDSLPCQSQNIGANLQNTSNDSADSSHRKRAAQESVDVVQNVKKMKEDNRLSIVERFHDLVSHGPQYICTSCNQLFFRHSVIKLNIQGLELQMRRLCTTGTKSVQDTEWICRQCADSLKRNKIPPCSVGNGLRFPTVPEPLKDLTALEERLVSPRIPFMQLRELPRGGQLSITGYVVNVPADVNNTVRVLPRNMSDTETIPLKLKRSLSFKGHVAFERIRPEKVLMAAKWLVTNSSLFQNEGITFNEQWELPATVSQNTSMIPEMVSNGSNSQNETTCTNESLNDTNVSTEEEWTENDQLQNDRPAEKFHPGTVSQNTSMVPEMVSNGSAPQKETTCTNESLNGKSASPEDEWTKNDELQNNQPAGNLDTLLNPADFRECNRILNVAPGEGNFPLGLYTDVYGEFLSFPSIYCGQVRQENNSRAVPLHYSTICKWELRNVDRRVATNVSNIFFKLKKLQIKQISDKVNLAIRKCKRQGKQFTAGQLLSERSVNSIMKHDEGYKILRTLRGSPPYWEKAKSDIFTMIRQLCIPTWFCSFSAAETKWTALFHTLFKLQYNKSCTDQEILALKWNEKCKLIKADPITCSRFFYYRVQVFLNNVLKHKSEPIGKISDFFYRVEFQQRGSPHIHMLIWIENAPQRDSHSDADIASFIDNYTSCEQDESISNLINYQTHPHASTCRKKGQAICRFGFPLPPMDKTVILHAISQSETLDDQIGKNYKKITSALDSLKMGVDSVLSFPEFLKSLSITYEDYILPLRSSIAEGHSKVFLKRSVSEIRINTYNKILLRSWEANMDIQYILDPYACATCMYVVSYISKGQRGMSKLLSEACKEARKNDSDIRQQVRKIGNTFLSHVEIGSQEAAYLLLQMPLRRASREIVFVNTCPEKERVVLIKSAADLKNLPKDSTAVEADNHIKRYQRRPRTLDKCCLADFVARYNVRFPSKKQKTDHAELSESLHELPETEYE